MPTISPPASNGSPARITPNLLLSCPSSLSNIGGQLQNGEHWLNPTIPTCSKVRFIQDFTGPVRGRPGPPGQFHGGQGQLAGTGPGQARYPQIVWSNFGILAMPVETARHVV